jgi:hypothetical protein
MGEEVERISKTDTRPLVATISPLSQGSSEMPCTRSTGASSLATETTTIADRAIIHHTSKTREVTIISSNLPTITMQTEATTGTTDTFCD